MEIFDDLEVELSRIDGILSNLSPEQWDSPSAASGWSVADVVVHLAQTEEFVLGSLRGTDRTEWFGDAVGGVDAVMSELVTCERDTTHAVVMARWRAAWTASVAALRAADPAQRLPWVTEPLRAASLATTRLAEHWAHTLDITTPLGLAYEDTDRLRHVAWLAHRTLPYAFTVALPGSPVPTVYAELTAPSGATWRYGSPNADVVITGPGAGWCRLGAQRTTPEESGLTARGDRADEVLQVVRNYAA
ncbi:MAG: maleylpyruvate isomerase family mycothiol-dependent enzyme [Pseudonocardiales bacterium]|nr:maleylpyruvate isomerase family mycothiol-dependent enzyme [Pseudonocardiales bacterium]